MKRMLFSASVAFAILVAGAQAYVEAPHSLGQVVKEASTIVLVEVVKVNKEKNLIIYKKLQDLKGKHPKDEIKHNIGKGGFHPREWQNIMSWAAEGKKAVFFHNGGASETCIGTYWYQCYASGEWWGMSHAEPFLLRTYCGDAEKLATAVTSMLQGQEVVVPCMADGNKDLLHQRKAKMQMMKASMKRLNYDVKRDFAGFGGEGEVIPEFKTVVLVPESTPGWKFLPMAQAAAVGNRWQLSDFDDQAWRSGKTPIGYGEEELKKRSGTIVAEQGQSFLFRRAFDLSAGLLAEKGVLFRLCVASDDNAVVYLNGSLADKDTEEDHEFSYWNRDIELPANLLRPGRNVLAVLVKNRQGSSDIYLDMEVSAQIPLPKPPPKKPPVPDGIPPRPEKPSVVLADDKPPKGLSVDKDKRAVRIACAIAPRKLANLDKTYPIEVIATYPAPKGQKAHETVVTFGDLRPSHVHKALEQLGLKAGKPGKGEARAEGPEVVVFLEIPGANGKVQRLPIEKTLVDSKTGKSLPPLKWFFTGSAFKQPDPEKDDKVYGADLTGTLIAIFPVTDDTVLQTQLTMKDEGQLKLEIPQGLLPKEGTPATLIIEVK